METIKNYLESMFAALPNTQEVRNAKAELLQMMEDKYNELVSNGTPVNAAVGTVISEFGNLDELAESLGLSKAVEETREKENESPRRYISLDEAKEYFSNRSQKSLVKSLGIMFCILSPAPVLLNFDNELIGVSLMFLCIAIGVGMIVFASCMDHQWKFIRRTLCKIDMNTATYVKDRKRSFQPVHALCSALGVALCVICWIPNLFFLEYETGVPGTALMFVLIGLGVFLIVYGNSVDSGFDRLLKVNDQKTVSGSYADEMGEIKYKSKTAEMVATMYWPTITCVYLIVSFLTFAWHLTWIIFVVAGVLHKAVMIYCVEEN